MFSKALLCNALLVAETSQSKSVGYGLKINFAVPSHQKEMGAYLHQKVLQKCVV